MVPNMLALLRKNLVANPEKLLLDRVEELLADLDKRAKPQAAETVALKINKVSTIQSRRMGALLPLCDSSEPHDSKSWDTLCNLAH